MEALKERPKPKTTRTTANIELPLPSSVDSRQIQLLVRRVENLEVLRDDIPINQEVQSIKHEETSADIVEEAPIPQESNGEIDQPEIDQSAEIIEEATNIPTAEESISAPKIAEDVPVINVKEEQTQSAIMDPAATSSKVQLYPEINGLRLQDLADQKTAVQQRQNLVRVKESAPPLMASLEPLTEMQLRSFYYNAELERVDDFVDEFLEATLRPTSGDEFLALLQSYLDSCRRVEQLLLDAQDLNQRWDSARRNVWLMENVVFRQQGTCGESKAASGAYTVQRAKFQQNCYDELKNLAQKRRHLRVVQLAFASHQSKTAELQCKHHVSLLLHNYRTLTGISAVSPIFIRFDEPNDQLTAIRKQIHNCVSILFHFLRQPQMESTFYKSCRGWLNDLCGSILRYSYPDDHLFLLCHVLRCPNGVGIWAAGYIQPVCHLNSSVDGERAVDHFLAMLNVCLNPIRRREDYLKCFLSPDVANSWTIVDVDGEEEKELVAISEADLLCLLNQFSFDQLFSAWFDHLQQSQLTETKILRLFAFELTVLRILFDGIRAYNGLQYKQVCKQLAYVMRQSVQYVAEFWLYFKSLQTDAQLCDRLQLEFDRLVLYTAYYGVSSKGLGVWQFLADLPYGDVSLDFLWHIIDLLLSPTSTGLSPRDIFDKPMAVIKEEMKDVKVLELRLHDLDETDATYMLTALSNMACLSNDPGLIQTLATLLFSACFESPSTRETHHKSGRELLAAIVERHPWVLSFLLTVTEARLDYLGGYALELFDHLPTSLWAVSTNDWSILRRWLFHPLASLQNTLAQRILQSCNWSLIPGSQTLFLPHGLHEEVAEAVVKAYDDLCPVQAGLISGSIKKASKMAGSVSGQLSTEQQFMDFCWTLLLRLKLHPFDTDFSETVDMASTDRGTAAELLERANNGNPFAAFVAFQCSVRNMDTLLEPGISLVERLVNNYFAKPATVCIVYSLRFLAEIENVPNAERWYRCFDALVHMDDTYYNYAKTYIAGYFTGENLASLGDALSDAVIALANRRQTQATSFVKCALRFCCSSISKPWFNDRPMLYILDRLIEASFLNDPTLKDVVEILRISYENSLLSQSRSGKGGVLSLFRGEKPPPPVLASSYFHDFPWLAYPAIKSEEAAFGQFYQTLNMELLRHPAQPLETCVKHAGNKVNTRFTCDRLVPFLYLELAGAMDVEHPLLPLVCQECCVSIFQRVRLPQDPSLPATCLGERYLRNESFASKVATLKKLLQSATSRQKQDESEKQLDDQRLQLFGAIQAWLSDIHLCSSHQPPATAGLPLAHVFCSILNGNIVPWLDYVDFTAVRLSVEKRAKEWSKCRYGDQIYPPHSHRRPTQISPLHRLFERLKNAVSDHLQPVPPLGPVDPVFFTPDIQILQDEAQIFAIISPLLDNFYAAANDFNDMQRSLFSLDELFLEQLKQLYTDVSIQVMVTLRCQKYCASPNNTKIMAKSSKLLDNIQNTLDQNRVTWTNTVENLSALVAYNIPHHCVCLYAIIRQLTRVYMETKLNADVKNRLQKTGVYLFYKLVSIFNDRIAEFPPTKALFHAVIENLGQTFVLRNSDEIEKLFALIKDKQSLFGLLISFFDPNCASNAAYLRIYDDLCGCVTKQKMPMNCIAECLKYMNVRNASTRLNTTELDRLNRTALRGCIGSKTDDKVALLNILRTHWTESFVAGLPSNFKAGLEALLEGCKDGATPAVLFDDLLAALNSKYTADTTGLGPAVFANIVKFLCDYFHNARIKCKECKTFGIYHCWETYASKVWPLLSFCFVRSILNPEAYSSASEGIRRCFSTLESLFGPWIVSYQSGNEFYSAWSLSASHAADAFVQAFVDSAIYVQKLLADQSDEGATVVCSVALEWYMKAERCGEKLGAYILRSYQSHLLRLPWHKFHISITNMDMLLQIIKKQGQSAPFATNLIVRLPWTTLFRSIAAMPTAVGTAISDLLLNIVVRCAGKERNYADCKASFPGLLQTLGVLDWSCLELPPLDDACSFVVQNYDPRCILRSDDQHSIDGGVVGLLEAAGHFGSASSTTTPQQLDSVVQKRVRSVRMLVALLVRCMRYADASTADVSQAFVGILSRIDFHVRSGGDIQRQQQMAFLLLSEAVLFLNQANKQLFDESVNASGRYLMEHSDSMIPLILMQAYGRLAATSAAWIAVSENCIEAYFARSTPSPSWTEVLHCLHYKDIWTTGLKSECQSADKLLVFYAYCSKRLQLRNELSQETVILRDVMETLKLMNERHFREPTLVILIGLALNLLVRQVKFGANASSVVVLVRELAACLQYASEGKSGFLSTLGLAKRVGYTPRFQLLCGVISNYCTHQIVDDDRIRLNAAAVVVNSRVQWAKNLKTQKQYATFNQASDLATSFLTDTSLNFGDTLKLYTSLTRLLFTEHYVIDQCTTYANL